jgi:hypothetical protein
MTHSDETANETNILSELTDLQFDFRLTDTDLSKIIGISNNYYCTIKTHSYISTFMYPIFKIAIQFFKKTRSNDRGLHFGKLIAESTVDFRKRKNKMVSELRKKFKAELDEQDKIEFKRFTKQS